MITADQIDVVHAAARQTGNRELAVLCERAKAGEQTAIVTLDEALRAAQSAQENPCCTVCGLPFDDEECACG